MNYLDQHMVTKLSRAQVNSWRLSKHHLVQRAGRRDLARVVSDVCGIQAQVLSAAELAVHARVEDVTRQDIRDALWKDHSILKTWCMRGTLHLLASDDLPLYVAALKTKLADAKVWLEKQGISPSETETVTSQIKLVLRNKTLTREELGVAVQHRTKLSRTTSKALGSAWGILLRPAAYRGFLAFGPSIGQKVTFLRPLIRNEGKEPEARDAYRQLFTRFLETYGPATVRDFGHWWGGLAEEERMALESMSYDLEEVEVDKFRGLMTKSDADEAQNVEPVDVVRLLPSFDCYVMFYSPREWVVPSAHRGRIFRQLAGWNYPSVIVDGVAAGIWGVKKRGKRLDVEVESFREFDSREKRGIEEEVARIGGFLGSPCKTRYLV